jgi:hypothetical protein
MSSRSTGVVAVAFVRAPALMKATAAFAGTLPVDDSVLNN